MNKTLIIPIVALFALVIKHSFGFEVPQEELDVIADGVLSITTMIGIFMHPVKQTEAAGDADKGSEQR